MRSPANLTFPAAICLTLMLLFLLNGNAVANVHGVESVEIVHAEEPPVYDLDQIESEVTDTIRRTKRNLWLRVAVLEIDPLGSAGNDCGSGNPLAAGVELLCEVGNAVGQAARSTEINKAIRQTTQAHTESDPALAPDLSSAVDKLLASNLLQLRLATAVEDFVADHTEIEIVGGSSDAVPGHQLAVNLARVEAVSNKIDSRIAIRLYGEAVLVSDPDGAIVDMVTFTVETPRHFIEGWSQGGIGLLAASFSEGIRKMAEVLAEELLLVVTSPHQRRKGYLVQPTAPKHKIGLFTKTEFITAGGEYRATNTLQPVFEWEDFREAYDKDPLYADSVASDLDVSYDLRIYRSRLGGDVHPSALPGHSDRPIMLVADTLLHEFRVISGEKFMPDITFDHCTPYAWTLRTRFIANGRTHLTYWSGSYSEKNLVKRREARISDKASVRTARSLGAFIGWDLDTMWRDETQYFPFLATRPGEKCSAAEIYAAMAKKSP